jgi:hypothetical protein
MQESWNDVVTLFSGPNTQAMHDIGVLPFLFLLAVVTAGSFVVAALYVHFVAARATGSEIYRAFPLLGLSIAAIFVAVQFSLPLSIGLLAALSIVRFRTPIKEPEEVGFLMVIVAVSVASATFKLQFLGILLAAAGIGLTIQRARSRLSPRTATGGIVVVSVPLADYRTRVTAISRILDNHFRGQRLDRVTNGPREVEVSYQFNGPAPPDVRALRLDLETQAIAPDVRVFMNRGQVS